jgi:hypothetical protein
LAYQNMISRVSLQTYLRWTQALPHFQSKVVIKVHYTWREPSSSPNASHVMWMTRKIPDTMMYGLCTNMYHIQPLTFGSESVTFCKSCGDYMKQLTKCGS